jgi:hypothetical protein
MQSPLALVLFTLMQAGVEWLPAVPAMTFEAEGPLSFFDAVNRAYLLCTLIPPAVVRHTDPALATSPWTLLITSFVRASGLGSRCVLITGPQMMANGGFMLVNAFSFLQPTALALTTPTELLPYGWTTLDLWAAPLITGLYALLTHAQPFWAEAHAMLSGAPPHADVKDPAGPAQSPGVTPLDAETARAACAVVLMVTFAARTTRNFGGARIIRGWLGQDAAGAAKKAQ